MSPVGMEPGASVWLLIALVDYRGDGVSGVLVLVETVTEMC